MDAGDRRHFQATGHQRTGRAREPRERVWLQQTSPVHQPHLPGDKWRFQDSVLHHHEHVLIDTYYHQELPGWCWGGTEAGGHQVPRIWPKVNWYILKNMEPVRYNSPGCKHWNHWPQIKGESQHLAALLHWLEEQDPASLPKLRVKHRHSPCNRKHLSRPEIQPKG